MHRFYSVSVRLIVVLTLSVSWINAQDTRRADLVFKNGAIYKSDAARTWADAVAIKDGKIIYVGPVKRCKANLNGKQWLIGSGWELPVFENANPSKELLDRIVS